MNNIKLCLITKGVYTYYKNMVKNNKNDTYILIRKKLSRNWILSELVKDNSDEEYECRRYGNLYMWLYRKTNRIVWLQNVKGVRIEFNIDLDLKDKLNKELGIE